MMKKIGFIGAGNMAGAIIGGIVKSGLVKPENVIASAKTMTNLEKLKEEYKINVTLDSREVVKNSDILFMAVKPNIFDGILEGVKDLIDDKKIVVSIAAGKNIEGIEKIIGADKKIVRTMPNTPALVNEGMSALCPNKNIEDGELKIVKDIFDSFGKSEVIGEYLIDAVIGVSGSSPAYVFMFIEAMADAAGSVVDYFKGNAVYINVMKNMSVDCDCCAVAEDPCIADIGILISDDPIAVDQACIDLVYACEDPGKAHFLKRVESRNGIHTIEAAAALGYGTREYELIEI